MGPGGIAPVLAARYRPRCAEAPLAKTFVELSDEELAKVPKPAMSMRGRMSIKEWQEASKLSRPGAHYGIEFPHDFKMMRDMGAAWLTKAFHIAGTLPLDNSVVSMKSTCLSDDAESEDSMGGSGRKGLIIVEYEKPHAELHTRLFFKM